MKSVGEKESEEKKVPEELQNLSNAPAHPSSSACSSYPAEIRSSGSDKTAATVERQDQVNIQEQIKMKFPTLFTLTALSWSLPTLANSDFTLPDRALLRALARRQHYHSNGTSLSELRARGLDLNSSHFAELEQRQTTGRCGANYGQCADNLCCSDYGYCGDSVDHCYPGFDCQPAYGVCGWPRPVATTSSTTSPRPSSTSTASTTRSTISSTTSTTSTTSTRSNTSSSLIPIPTGGIITTNGQCGNSTVCPGVAGAGWGPCCSQFFWCGSGPEYCGTGCQSAFGLCDDSSPSPSPPGTTTSSTSTTSRITTTSTTSTTSTRTSSTTSAGPTFTLPPGQVSSRDGRCGNGQNCLGSTYGRCCSQFGWCGEGDQFCPYIVGCQTEFGYCDPPV